MSDKYFISYTTVHGLHEITLAQGKKLTHLNVAFAPMVEGGIVSIEHARKKLVQLKRIRAINPDLQILISTGGGANKGHGEATKTEEGLAKLVKSTMDIVEEFDFDGIDCDWEFPGDTDIMEEKYQHTALMKAYREALDCLSKKRNNKKYWLTIAAGVGEWCIERLELDKSHHYMDFINLMTYDLRCNSFYSGHHTNLYESENSAEVSSCDTNIRLVVEAGVPIEKIALGVAFYSREMNGLSKEGNVFNQTMQEKSDYGPDYTAIQMIFEKHMDYVKYWDEQAKAPYLFNGDNLISYDDPMSVKYKCDYVHEKNLIGAFYWVHGSDKTGTLFQAMYDGLYLR